MLKFLDWFQPRSEKSNLFNPLSTSKVNETWIEVTNEFEYHASSNVRPRMKREELSFHSDVKLLGHLCLEVEALPGDILEIGVWKGKSLAFMRRLCTDAIVIGIDPFEFDKQIEEIAFFQERIFKEVVLIKNFSEFAFVQVSEITSKLKLLHIDGGHEARNVVLDFLLYSSLVVPGGYIVFDDYADWQFSPDVRPTVDMLIKNGFTRHFKLIGQTKEYPNSYVLKRI